MHYQLAPATGEFHHSLLTCLGCCFACVPELARDTRKLATKCCDRPQTPGACCP